MLCPHDNIEMKHVQVMSHYGHMIDLEQCEKCGGIWFDESEMYSAKQGEAEKIEALNVEILRSPSIIENDVHICPRDKTVLQRFSDSYFPRDIILESCPLCHGIWLNRGMFTKYQGYRNQLQQKKEPVVKDAHMEKKIQQLIAAHQSGQSTETLRKLGAFLSTPVDDIKYPISPMAGNAVSTILNIVIALLRAFVFKL
ncbi:MAG: hypothetical protein EHM12_03310 [Dehalococcoidia bacterium]|nr:MAG: hypothetical protein EHM12_03310 [Dehalococcoidia bacterium]